METEYSIFHPPFSIAFKEMEKKVARNYLEWFLEQIPKRVLILANYVQSFSGYDNWRSDLTPSSLDGLGKWFFENVTIRKRSGTEIENIYSNGPDWFKNIEIPDYELTDRTLSFSIDIGMYLSQVLMQNIPDLRWKIGPKPMKSIDYQQPVLTGTGKLNFNPIHITITLAYGIANRTKGPERLRELYDIWANLLQHES